MSDSGDLIGELLEPLVQEAHRRRAARRRNDSGYSHRVDADLNAGRLNLLLFGYGETVEPPITERQIIGSDTILSLNLSTRKVDVVSLTHDTRAPEIERHLGGGRSPNKEVTAIKIDQAYRLGGFDLMRRTLENATGFSLDFQMVMRDVVIRKAVDYLFQGITVDVPFELETVSFSLEGETYPEGYFPRGRQKIDGLQVMQFMKALSKPYDPLKERNVRKHLILQALFESTKDGKANPLLWVRTLAFLRQQWATGRIRTDFDFSPLLGNINGIIYAAGSWAPERRGRQSFPGMGEKVYIVDSAIGDGGVQWVTASQNPITKRDLAAGMYPDEAVEVPFDADPYAEDLVSDYWASVRRLIKAKLAR